MHEHCLMLTASLNWQIVDDYSSQSATFSQCVYVRILLIDRHVLGQNIPFIMCLQSFWRSFYCLQIRVVLFIKISSEKFNLYMELNSRLKFFFWNINDAYYGHCNTLNIFQHPFYSFFIISILRNYYFIR